MSETTIVQDFNVPPARLFEALSDQDRMGQWMGAKISVPVRGGDGLVGTVRRIHVGPVGVDERIEAADAPRFLAYRIVSPTPFLKHHRGELRIEPRGQGSRLTWHIVLQLSLPMVGDVVLASLRPLISRGLARLAKKLV